MQRLLLTNLIQSYCCYLLLFALVSLYSSPVFSAKFVNAGPPIVNIEQIGKNRLSSINLILQDSLGFIWLIKNDGLFRYDSKELKQFPGHQQFSIDKVTALVEGRPGHIWLATRTNGLVHFDTHTTELTFHNLADKFELTASGNEVDLLIYKNSTLYLTSKNQLRLINDQRLTVNQRITLPIADSDFLISMMLDSAGNIWFSSLKGNAISRLINNETRHYQHLMTDATTIGSKSVFTVFEDSQDRIWLGTLKGLALYLPDTDSFFNIQPIDMALDENKFTDCNRV